MAVRTTLLTAVRLEASKSNGVPPPNPKPLLSLSKPSWTVRTESNVRKLRKKTPDPPCVVCRGSGRVDCSHCHGKGRTNFTDLAMLPKGEWPKWCHSCGGSGLGYCSRCLGTGEYRDKMGFHFTKMDSAKTRDQSYEGRRKTQRQNESELLLAEKTSPDQNS